MDTIKIDELREKITALQKAVEDLKESGMRESLLYVAIQRAAGTHRKGRLISTAQIKLILQGIESLDDYVFPKKEAKDGK